MAHSVQLKPAETCVCPRGGPYCSCARAHAPTTARVLAAHARANRPPHPKTASRRAGSGLRARSSSSQSSGRARTRCRCASSLSAYGISATGTSRLVKGAVAPDAHVGPKEVLPTAVEAALVAGLQRCIANVCAVNTLCSRPSPSPSRAASVSTRPLLRRARASRLLHCAPPRARQAPTVQDEPGAPRAPQAHLSRRVLRGRWAAREDILGQGDHEHGQHVVRQRDHCRQGTHLKIGLPRARALSDPSPCPP